MQGLLNLHVHVIFQSIRVLIIGARPCLTCYSSYATGHCNCKVWLPNEGPCQELEVSCRGCIQELIEHHSRRGHEGGDCCDTPSKCYLSYGLCGGGCSEKSSAQCSNSQGKGWKEVLQGMYYNHTQQGINNVSDHLLTVLQAQGQLQSAQTRLKCYPDNAKVRLRWLRTGSV